MEEKTNTASTLSEWPGAFGIYKISKAAIMLNIGPFIGLIAVIFGTTIVYTILRDIFSPIVLKVLLEVVYELVNIVLSASLVYATIQSVRGKEINVGEALSAVYKKSVDIILVTILVGIIAIVSLLLLIVPAFFIIPRIYLAVYFVIDKGMSPMEALQASWDHTKGNVGKSYGIFGVNILILIPIITIIGIIATVYFGVMYYAAYAVLYNYITKKKVSTHAKA